MSGKKPGAAKPRRGFGARLEALFQPRLHWGAEFLEDRVRICGLKTGDGKTHIEKSFEGPYPEAEAFARKHGLAYEAVHGAVSHLPFKITALDAPAGSEDEGLSQAEAQRPDGLPVEALDFQGFQHGPAGFMLMIRSELPRNFRDHLSPSLGSLWDLSVSPLALLPFLAAGPRPNRLAALLPEASHTHVLFFRQGVLEAYGKVFIGFDLAARNPSEFQREMKKTLVYHYASRFPESELDALQLWQDGPNGEIAAALAPIGIAQVTPEWIHGLAASPFLVAAAVALAGINKEDSPGVLAMEPSPLARSRRVWLRRTGRLARLGYQAVAVLAVMAFLIGLAAAGLEVLVKSKMHAWAGELGKWEAFQHKKAKVEAQMGGLQSLLSRRTESYAGLQRIAQSLPPELWLDSWEMEATPGGLIHRLEGYSLVESRVPEFLGNLEKAGRFQSVKLKSTEKIKGEVVEQKTAIAANRKDLTHFQLSIIE